MRGDNLLDNMAFIDPELVAEAEAAHCSKGKFWFNHIASAACLALIITACISACRWFLPLGKDNLTIDGQLSTAVVIEDIDNAITREPRVHLVVNEVAEPLSTDRIVFVGLFDDSNQQELAEFQDFIGTTYEDFVNRIPSLFLLQYIQTHHNGKADDSGVIKEGTLESYHLHYRTENGGSVSIAISSLGEPQRGAFFPDNNPCQSYIEDTSLIIRKNNRSFWVQFEYDGIYYDIETADVSQSELTALLISLIFKNF